MKIIEYDKQLDLIDRDICKYLQSNIKFDSKLINYRSLYTPIGIFMLSVIIILSLSLYLKPVFLCKQIYKNNTVSYKLKFKRLVLFSFIMGIVLTISLFLLKKKLFNK